MNANGFIEKTEWPSNSPDLNPLDYHFEGAMLKKYHKLQLKPKMIDELKVALQTVWEELLQEQVNIKAVVIFTKHLTAYVAVAANVGRSLKHLQ